MSPQGRGSAYCCENKPGNTPSHPRNTPLPLLRLPESTVSLPGAETTGKTLGARPGHPLGSSTPLNVRTPHSHLALGPANHAGGPGCAHGPAATTTRWERTPTRARGRSRCRHNPSCRCYCGVPGSTPTPALRGREETRAAQTLCGFSVVPGFLSRPCGARLRLEPQSLDLTVPPSSGSRGEGSPRCERKCCDS